ncbi:conserved hypothetical protein [Neospora caninum Liverpool]|uniref:Transmembrane protein n=1 Tax=Neospora caninum (strain Liverpool) TaxID=572307 RepID=F0V921_NEOCL|nr:conserved hypothetical protein [Neospora caninum Liverpool]CBZ50212.1 conserved hypothetical protein [Neospora caninum Liverpool]CEL64813.1 TPA: hypothetical protein BN1204_006870 [Neospora caninum Liverpool]|eukprot:XP_003880247.1 conserved hypothetical protein [Neospora caninum Liverpool]
MEVRPQAEVPSPPSSEVLPTEVPSSTNLILNTASLVNWAYYVLAILAFLSVRNAKRRADRSARRGIRYLEAARRKTLLEERKKWQEHQGRKAAKTGGLVSHVSSSVASSFARLSERGKV